MTPTARFLRALVVLLGLAFAPIAFAQGIVTAGITGTVRDTGSKPMPGVSVTATHTPTGTAYTAVTSDTGVLNIEPVAALLMGWMLLGQSLSLWQGLGALVVIGAIIVLGTAKR